MTYGWKATHEEVMWGKYKQQMNGRGLTPRVTSCVSSTTSRNRPTARDEDTYQQARDPRTIFPPLAELNGKCTKTRQKLIDYSMNGRG